MSVVQASMLMLAWPWRPSARRKQHTPSLNGEPPKRGGLRDRAAANTAHVDGFIANVNTPLN